MTSVSALQGSGLGRVPIARSRYPGTVVSSLGWGLTSRFPARHWWFKLGKVGIHGSGAGEVKVVCFFRHGPTFIVCPGKAVPSPQN